MLPTVTLPNLKLAGFGDKSPVDIPVPVSGILRDGFEAFEVMATVPLALPAVAGVNFTVNVVVAPAASVTGVVTPLVLKPVPLMLT